MTNDQKFYKNLTIGELEKRVLGSILFRNDSILEVKKVLKPSMFMILEHGKIYSCMIELYEESIKFDESILIQRLDSKNSFNSISFTKDYINEIYNSITTATFVKDYTQEIYNNYLERHTDDQLANLITKRKEKKIRGEKYFEELSRLVLSINNLVHGDKSVEVTKVNIDSDELFKDLERKLNLKSIEINGQTTGFKKIDRVTDGFKPGQLINMTGDSGSGKSLMALQIGLHVCEKSENNRVQYFSLEMTKEELQQRSLSIYSGINSEHIKHPKKYFMNTNEKHEVIFDNSKEKKEEYYNKIKTSVEKFNKLNLYIDEESGLLIEDIEIRAKRFALQVGKQSLIIIDHTDILHDHSNPVRDISVIYSRLKVLAKELNCPILTLHQFGKDVKNNANRRPNKFNLIGSSAINHNCDIILLLYRPAIYADLIEEKPELKDVFDITVEKNRDGEPGQRIVLDFKGNMIIERN